MNGQFDNDTATISHSLREIIDYARAVDDLSYDEVLEQAQQPGSGSLFCVITTPALTTPIQTATGEGFFTDIVTEWGALNGHAEGSKMLVGKVNRFALAIKRLRRWVNDEYWLAGIRHDDDAREDLIERRIALGELTQELIRFGESFLRTISKETPEEIPGATYGDRTVAKWFGVTDARTIRRWRTTQNFPKSPVTFAEASQWASTNEWAQATNKRIEKRPSEDIG